MYHDKQTSHSSRVLISYFHLSRKLKTLNHVSRNNSFHPLLLIADHLSLQASMIHTRDKIINWLPGQN